MATTIRSNKELIEPTCDAMSAKDREAFRELQAPNIVQHDGREVLHGVDIDRWRNVLLDPRWGGRTTGDSIGNHAVGSCTMAVARSTATAHIIREK